MWGGKESESKKGEEEEEVREKCWRAIAPFTLVDPLRKHEPDQLMRTCNVHTYLRLDAEFFLLNKWPFIPFSLKCVCVRGCSLHPSPHSHDAIDKGLACFFFMFSHDEKGGLSFLVVLMLLLCASMLISLLSDLGWSLLLTHVNSKFSIFWFKTMKKWGYSQFDIFIHFKLVFVIICTMILQQLTWFHFDIINLLCWLTHWMFIWMLITHLTKASVPNLFLSLGVEAFSRRRLVSNRQSLS